MSDYGYLIDTDSLVYAGLSETGLASWQIKQWWDPVDVGYLGPVTETGLAEGAFPAKIWGRFHGDAPWPQADRRERLGRHCTALREKGWPELAALVERYALSGTPQDGRTAVLEMVRIARTVKERDQRSFWAGTNLPANAA